MNNKQTPEYLKIINELKLSTLKDTTSMPKALVMSESDDLSIYYAPFDYINRDAKVVIVGITPGFTQLRNAYYATQSCNNKGMSINDTLKEVKSKASFSGEIMRKNLVDMLNHVGLNNWLGINSCLYLFNTHSNLLHSTSALKFPVFVSGKNYNGTPNMLKNQLLKSYLTEYFGEEVKALSDAIFIPLGPKPAEALGYLAQAGYISESKILLGFPHPSPANMERINYFLGKKPKAQLSIKTNSEKIDIAKASIISKLDTH